MHISKVYSTTVSSADTISNNKQPVSKQSFSGTTHKSVDKFFRRSFLTTNDEELHKLHFDVLQSIKDITSGLHKDTIVKVKHEITPYLPLSDTHHSFDLYAVNKKFLNSKCRIAPIGCDTGCFCNEIVSFIDWQKDNILKTLRDVDKLFVQFSKNLYIDKNSESKQTAEKRKIIEEFAKSINMDPETEIDLNQYPFSL